MTGVALITGGTSGLGLATARRLLLEGWTPVLVGRGAQAGRAAVEQLGGSAHFVCGDVASETDIASAVQACVERGELRAVVNCAGVGHAARLLGRTGVTPLSDFETVIRTNLLGALNVTRLAVAAMMGNVVVRGERGVVVHTASVAAFEGQDGQAAYAAAKAGVVGMTLPLARELAHHGIRVVCIAPGLLATQMTRSMPQDVIAKLLASVPFPPHLGDAADFAALVHHILGNQMINGETIRLDGALRLPARLRTESDQRARSIR